MPIHQRLRFRGTTLSVSDFRVAKLLSIFFGLVGLHSCSYHPWLGCALQEAKKFPHCVLFQEGAC